MKYDLVFEGDGAKGMVFVGAMQEFMAQEHTYQRLLGTSAGAITATFLAAEYSPQEMLAALNETENGQPVFATFMGPPAAFDEEDVRNSATLALLQNIDVPLITDGLEAKVDFWLAKTLMQKSRNLFSFIERGGWYSAHKFTDWMKRKLDEGDFRGQPRHFSEMTLSEYHTATERDMSLVTSDTTGGHMLVLNHQTTPDLPLVWAVRMSMSIPMVWPEVEWQPEWGLYRGKDIAGHRMVDGGLLSNFPIELFVSDDSHITAVMGQKKKDTRVLGFLIDESKPVNDAPARAAAAADTGLDFGQLELVQRLNRLINTATGAHDKMVIEAFEDKVVHLPAQGFGTTEFDMSDERRKALIEAGRQAMEEYLAIQDETSFSLVDQTHYEIDVANHADEVAARILDW